MNNDNEVSKNDLEIDAAKRETLRKLAGAAWAVPVVATFSLGALATSTRSAMASNAIRS